MNSSRFANVNEDDSWQFAGSWDTVDFGLAANDSPVQVSLNVDVTLTASGFGGNQISDAMALIGASIVPTATVPEPSTALLFGLGLAVAGTSQRARRP